MYKKACLLSTLCLLMTSTAGAWVYETGTESDTPSNHTSSLLAQAEHIQHIKQGLTQLSQLIQENKLDEMIALLEDPRLQETINSTLANGQTALTLAAASQAWECFDYLVDEVAGIDLNQVNRFGETPLMYLSILGQLDRVKYLVNKGAKVDNWGWNALHYASLKSHAKVLEFLITQNPWVDSPTPEGDTALILAVRAKCFECALHLYIAGADPTILNTQGESAMMIAQQTRQKRLFELFQTK